MSTPSLSRGASINVDFDDISTPTYSGTGAAPDPGTVWNGVGAAALNALPLIDSLGMATSVTLTKPYVDDFSNAGGATPTSNELLLDYLFVFNASSTMTIGGLVPYAPYSLFVYGAGDQPDQSIDVEVAAANGGATGSTTADTRASISTPENYIQLSVQADGSGYISFTWQNNDSSFGAINGLQVIATCGNSNVDPGEDCDDGGTADGDCCSAICQYEPNGNPCPTDGNVCTDDVCDGAGFCGVPNTAPCDDEVFCNGMDTCSGGTCSHSGDPCAAGPECDNSCNEAADNCFAAGGTGCSSDGNPCTLDQCDGAGSCDHPAGNAGALCRSAAGACDVAELCTGASTACPPDAFEPLSTTCRASTGECDVAEQCSGVSASCPSDLHISGGTACTSDGSICTTDQCNGAGLCVHPDNGTCENSSVNLPPGGTISSDTENDGATPSDPVETSITVPGGGTVSIEERPFTNSPDGFFLLGNEVEINAPNAGAANPLVMAFRLDASVLFPQPFGQAEIDVGYPFIFKDAALVANCSGAPGVASPDPCVASRVLQGDGDVIVTILTSTASLWQFAVPTGDCPDTIDNGCMTGFQKAFLLIKENVPGKEKLIAKLGGGPALAQTDLGNPLSGAEGGTGTRVSLCIYDGNGDLAGELVAAGPTSTCTEGAPCWKSIGAAPNDPNGPGKGYAYKDTNAATDGLQKLLYKGGEAGKPKAIIKAKGSTLPLGIPAALQSSSQATIQLRSSDGECLSAAVTEIKKREAEFFKGK
jgi:hypothetical protein